MTSDLAADLILELRGGKCHTCHPDIVKRDWVLKRGKPMKLFSFLCDNSESIGAENSSHEQLQVKGGKRLIFLSEGISFFLPLQVNFNSFLVTITFSAGKKPTTLFIYSREKSTARQLLLCNQNMLSVLQKLIQFFVTQKPAAHSTRTWTDKWLPTLLNCQKRVMPPLFQCLFILVTVYH